MSRVVVEKMLRDNRKSTFGLQITSMVDMFTIMLVFLLQSQSTSSTNITTDQKLKLPASTSTTEPIEALRVVVTEEAIFVESEKILDLQNKNINPKDLDPKDQNLASSLHQALLVHANRSRDIASKNETVQFDGHVIIQADEGLHYKLLRQVMYTCSAAGYADIKLATVLTEAK